MGEISHLDSESFKGAITQKFAVIDFWAEWCGPCRIMNPILEELASEFKGKIFFGKVNVDDNPELSQMYSITAVPTMLFFSNNQIVGQVIGAISKDSLKRKLIEEAGL